MPPAPSERDLYEELLVSMGAVLPAHQAVTTLRQRTRMTARQLEVRMLVIDEIHSILAWIAAASSKREIRTVTPSVEVPAKYHSEAVPQTITRTQQHIAFLVK